MYKKCYSFWLFCELKNYSFFWYYYSTDDLLSNSILYMRSSRSVSVTALSSSVINSFISFSMVGSPYFNTLNSVKIIQRHEYIINTQI